jgi:hypothetical protein
MSAYRVVHLYCDDRSSGRKCFKEFDSDPSLGFPTLTVMRREARKAGWSYARSTFGRSFDKDFCPDHKPED